MTDPRNIILALLVATVAAGGSGVLGYARGHSAGIEDEKGAQARADLAVLADRADSSASAQSEIDYLALKGAEQDTRQAEVFRTIREHTREIIERPVYRNVCIDADGVRQLDRAVAAANADPQGDAEPAGTAAEIRGGPPSP